MSAAAWPEGVVARYLTVGGATVTIDDSGPDQVAAWCNSPCGFCLSFHGEHLYEQSEPIRAAKAYAQKHAETCRAMPQPDTKEQQ